MKKIYIFIVVVIVVIGSIMFIYNNRLDEKNKEIVNEEEVEVKEATKGYIWEAIRDNDIVYLVGTMHPAPENINFFNSEINDIVSNTKGVALEVDFNNTKNEELVDANWEEFYTLKDTEIKDLLTYDEGVKLEDILKDYKLNYNDIKNNNANGVISILNNRINWLAGFNGVSFDKQLNDIYKDQGKEIIALETLGYQLDFLNNNKEIDDLRKFISEYSSNNIDSEVKYLNELLDGYVIGDKEIGEIAIEKMKIDQEFYNRIIVERNIKMADKIDLLAMTGEKYMVAVGYTHYFGEDSIIKLLERKGYTVKVK